MPIRRTYKLLSQKKPATTSAILAIRPVEDTYVLVKSIFVANTTAGAVSFSIYVDKDGEEAEADTALYQAVSVAANTTTLIQLTEDNAIVLENSDSRLYVKSSAGNSLTFTIFGLEIEET